MELAKDTDDIPDERTEMYNEISERLIDLIYDFMKVVPVPDSFGQRQALEHIKSTTNEIDEAMTCRRMIEDLKAGKEINFPREEVEKAYRDIFKDDSVSHIWRKFKPAKDITG